MQGSKIRLSPAEAALFCNAEVILTKNSILQKTVDLLGEVQTTLTTIAPRMIRDGSPSPKISKGENYLGLPYVVLDYPRIATNQNIFFIRSMFWWGKFYSSTLQISGSYKQQFEEKLSQGFELLKERRYFIGVNTDPWAHHFEESNYQPIAGLSTAAFQFLLTKEPHIKIAASWPISEWDLAANRLTASWKFLTELIA